MTIWKIASDLKCVLENKQCVNIVYYLKACSGNDLKGVRIQV